MKQRHIAFGLTAFMTLLGLHGLSQQRPQFTHYMYNALSINPAFAGSQDALSIAGITRHQWVGLEGAPTTQTITLHSPILNQHIGVGTTILSDRVGPDQRLQWSADFAYRMRVARNHILAFGMKGGVYYRSSRLSELVTVDDDVSFNGDLQTKLIPNVGVGAYYEHPKFYVGLSVPNLLESDYYKNQVQVSQAGASEKRHYYLIAGSNIVIHRDLEVVPTTQVKMVQDAPIEVDLTTQVIIQKKFWIGAMYRYHSAAGVLAAFAFSEQLKVGYAFDLPLTSLRSESFGTHEVMLTYDFQYTRKPKVRSPRYY